MQFQVPQFIETEDKIIGPLTIRQFIYVAAAGGLSALLYFVVQTWLWLILSLFLVGAAIALAFIKIEGRPLTHVVVAALGFYWKPQMYVWREERAAPKAKPQVKPEAGFSLERIVSGMALHKAWQNLQTGTKKSVNDQIKTKITKERYEVFRRQSGEREAARRVDYR